jgi:hypothetical protein
VIQAATKDSHFTIVAMFLGAFLICGALKAFADKGGAADLQQLVKASLRFYFLPCRVEAPKYLFHRSD